MEVLRQIRCFSGPSIDTQSAYQSSSSLRGPVDFGVQQWRVTPLRGGRGKQVSQFRDKGHLEYYCNSGSVSRVITCAKKEKEIKLKNKKSLKFLEGLSRDLSMFSDMGVGLESDQDKSKMISDATDVLLQQLQLLKAEEKELKKKRKEEKARLKAARKQNKLDPDSSSSSCSESSDSECGEVVDMKSLKCLQSSQPVIEGQELPSATISPPEEPMIESRPLDITAMPIIPLIPDDQEEATTVDICGSYSPEPRCCTQAHSLNRDIDSVSIVSFSDQINSTHAAQGTKIEVCMGGKCKKYGAGTLLEELQKFVGMQGAVSPCKCMGKCRDGPNVRVSSMPEGGLDGSSKPSIRPLYIGVGLDDVSLIVSNVFGEHRNELGMAASS